MDEPNTGLWEKTYVQDWKDWISWRLRQSDWDNLNHAIKVIMIETRGLISPRLIMDCYYGDI